ncbi:MAG: TetR family transcriptional regulator [Betaproteobacteria bacterium HGW-Betaproteobacteria-16]|nr:MAG: TetR family transcriptional regulator [Betaproteobacteria bacterium HGW-Betaproteobacteria-16]
MNQPVPREPLRTPNEHRFRLLKAMADVAARKGYAEATIADIVREAGVSKRTFYENFESKDACFLELYRSASHAALQALRSSLAPDKPWQAQVEHALSTYFAHLAAGPALVRTLFVEIHQLGPAGMRVRREVMQHLADFMLETVNAPLAAPSGSRPTGEPPMALSRTMALAAVGGINELVLESIEKGETEQLQTLSSAAGEVVRALTHAHLKDQ